MFAIDVVVLKYKSEPLQFFLHLNKLYVNFNYYYVNLYSKTHIKL